MKILIAENNSIFKKGINEVLSCIKNIEISEAKNKSQLIRLLKTRHYDLLLLGHYLRKKYKNDLYEQIKEIFPDDKIIKISDNSNEEFIISKIKKELINS